jgi:hypothetical protein
VEIEFTESGAQKYYGFFGKSKYIFAWQIRSLGILFYGKIPFGRRGRG